MQNMANSSKKKIRKRTCSIISCSNSRKSNSLNTEIKYHRCPKNKQIREYWLKFTRRSDINPDACYICSDHFLEDDYEKCLRAGLIQDKLRDGALPAIYLKVSKQAELPVEEQETMEEENLEYINKIFDECFPNDKRLPNTDEEVPAYCIVVNCMSTNKELSLFSFPKNESLKEEWVKTVPCKRKITENARVCEKHFLPNDLIRSKKIINGDGSEMIYELKRPEINPGAVPRILPTIMDINQPNENNESNSPEIESINFETVSMPLPPLKRKSNSSSSEAKRKKSMENDPEYFYQDDRYSSADTLYNTSSNKSNTNLETFSDKEAQFRENLQDFGNFIISSLNGIYDEELMLSTQQEIAMACFEAKSKWIAKKKSFCA